MAAERALSRLGALVDEESAVVLFTPSAASPTVGSATDDVWMREMLDLLLMEASLGVLTAASAPSVSFLEWPRSHGKVLESKLPRLALKDALTVIVEMASARTLILFKFDMKLQVE
jgi:hypothetical protein